MEEKMSKASLVQMAQEMIEEKGAPLCGLSSKAKECMANVMVDMFAFICIAGPLKGLRFLEALTRTTEGIAKEDVEAVLKSCNIEKNGGNHESK